jgi:hypothetical protein
VGAPGSTRYSQYLTETQQGGQGLGRPLLRMNSVSDPCRTGTGGAGCSTVVSFFVSSFHWLGLSS